MSKNEMIMLPREVAARPPSVDARTCANCLHNKPPFGNCDGCSQQNDDADDEGNWEPIPEPQGEQEPDAFYEWWRMRPSLTRLQAWLIWKDEHKQPDRAHGIWGEE